MDRRQIITGLPLIGVAAVASGSFVVAREPDHYPLATELSDAIATETATYLAAAPGGLSDEDAGEVTGAVGKIVHRLAKLPPHGRDYQLAVALALKWGLVAEGAHYSDYFEDRLNCGLTDSILDGSPFDDAHLPMLWHINGGPYLSRPTDEEFNAARETGQ